MSQNYRGGRGKWSGGNNAAYTAPPPSPEMEAAAAHFSCDTKYITKFYDSDPFNLGNSLEGCMCKSDGPNFGSMYLTHVNNQKLPTPQVIYGMPSIRPLDFPGPGEDPAASNPFEKLPIGSRYYFANKWNGFALSVYKYLDTKGTAYFSVRPRAFPFVKDLSTFQATLTTTKEVLKLTGKAKRLDVVALPEGFKVLSTDKVQSVYFEVCGSPHDQLVKYNFTAKAIPFLVTYSDGSVMPQQLSKDTKMSEVPKDAVAFWNEDLHRDLGPIPVDSTAFQLSSEFRKQALEANNSYRSKNDLTLATTFNNFVVEGKILYILNDDNQVLNRTAMYKIKPADFDRTHWPNFDVSMQALVMQAVEKLHERELPVNATNLRKELNFGDREWDKFHRDILPFVEPYSKPWRSDPDAPLKMLIMVGVPGSGKSTVAQQLAEKGWLRVNQDEMGTRKQCEAIAARALKQRQSVVVDRCNFDFSQRWHFIKLARDLGVGDIRCLFLNIPRSVCKSRVSNRKDHPTIPDGEAGHAIIDNFKNLLAGPQKAEGYSQIIEVVDEQGANRAVDHFGDLLAR